MPIPEKPNDCTEYKNSIQNSNKIRSDTHDKVKDNLEDDTNWKEEFYKIIRGASPFEVSLLNREIDKLIETHGTKNMKRFLKVTEMLYGKRNTPWIPRSIDDGDIRRIFNDYNSLTPQQVDIITDENLAKWQEIVDTYDTRERYNTHFSNLLEHCDTLYTERVKKDENRKRPIERKAKWEDEFDDYGG